MTPDEHLAQLTRDRLAEDRHLELLRALSEIKALMTVAASSVITDPEALRISVDNVIKDAE